MAPAMVTENDFCVRNFLPCQFVPQVHKIKTAYTFNQIPWLADLHTNGKPQKSEICC